MLSNKQRYRDGLETSAMVNFKLYSPRKLLFPRCLGRAQIPVADMLNTDENRTFTAAIFSSMNEFMLQTSDDPLLLFGGSSLATVGLKISSSTNSKDIAGILVKGTQKPKDPLGKIGPMLDCVVAVKKMIDILTEVRIFCDPYSSPRSIESQ